MGRTVEQIGDDYRDLITTWQIVPIWYSVKMLRWLYTYSGSKTTFFHILIIRFPSGCIFQNGLNDPSIIYGCRIMRKNVSKLWENQGVTIKWSKIAQNGQKWPKNTQNYLFGHFDYVMILSLFFLCFFAVNENLAGKKLNVQEKKLPPEREICQFSWAVFGKKMYKLAENGPHRAGSGKIPIEYIRNNIFNISWKFQVDWSIISTNMNRRLFFSSNILKFPDQGVTIFRGGSRGSQPSRVD